MAPPIHQRMEMYHEMSPPPIPSKLKPKTLKKLSQQGRGGPVYVIVPNPPPGQGPSQPHQRSSYNSNFTLMPRHHQHVPLVPMPPPPPPPPSATTCASAGSINSGGGSGSILLDNHQRFRPDKPNSSRPRVQQLQQWMRHERNSANWIKHLTDDDDDDEEEEDNQRRNHVSNVSSQVQLSSRVASMTIADVSPRFALKKILMLSENRQYRESANFINRLSGNTFGVIVHDLPVDLFIDSMPQSLPIIESLYAKVFLSDGILTRTSLQFLRPDAVVMQMVRFFAQHQVPSPAQAPAQTGPGYNAPFGPLGAPRSWDFCGPFISSCKKLLRVIVLSEPNIRKGLQQKRRALDKAIEGLGQHGLVGTDEAGLMPLHDALQVEFRRVVNSYKIALAKLEELELAGHGHTGKKSPTGHPLAGRTVSSGPAPIAASHQRLLSLKQNEVQERLIKNKTLLNVVEPTLTNHSLDLFLGILQRRIELDKDVLFQFAQLKRQGSNSSAATGSSSVSGSSSSSKSPTDSSGNAAAAAIAIAPLLMNYSHGCQQVLELMREVSTDQGRDAEEDATEDSSDVSGYHSDSDSAVMASGNSPFVSKSARYNFLSRSVRLGSRASIRTSLLVNSLGLETAAAGIKGQSRQQQQQKVHGQGLHQKLKPSTTTTATAQSHRTTMADCTSTPTATTSSGGDTSSAPSSCRSSPDPRTNCQRCHQQQQQTDLQMELESIKAEMKKANSTINALQEREKQMKVRLANQAQKMVERGVMGVVSVTAAEQRSTLIRSYGNLYAQSRIETLECLDKLQGLRDADELKSKLLFSVVVLAFRSLQATSAQMKEHVRRILQIPPNLMAMNAVSTANHNNSNKNPNITTISLATTTIAAAGGIPTPPPPPPPSILSTTVKRPLPPPPPAKRTSSNNNKERYHPGLEVEHALASYLRQSVDSFDLTKNTEDVCNQIWATLFDYPCLQSCDGLVKYIKDSVRLAWSLVNQSPPLVLEYEARHFTPELHVRFHTSNPNEETIKTYLWPALVEGQNGPCLHKAVVIT